MAKQLGHLVQIDDPNDDVAIRVEHVSKSFTLPHNKQNSIKGGLINLVSRGDRTYETQEVLKDVSFEIKKGEFFGIVGRNGSGKSTLLKMLAGIYTPSKGKIIVNGSLTPFIELGVGFNPELTGRENVYLNGALLGFNRAAMDEMYEDIVAFAELERFMDQKLKNYSSGMQVRLAFSIAIRTKSEILLIDEVLAVGDAAFQQKCYEYFTNMKLSNQTVVLVTHDMTAVNRFCERALLLNDGRIKNIGSSKVITDDYLELNYTEQSVKSGRSISDVPIIAEVAFLSSQKPDSSSGLMAVATGERCTVSVKIDNPHRLKFHVGVQIFNESGTYCFGANTGIDNLSPGNSESMIVQMIFNANLVAGTYSITAAVMNDTASKVLEYRPRILSFRVKSDSKIEGIVELLHEWSMN